MKKTILARVTGIALLSRIIIIFLQFIFNVLIPDHQSDGFVSPFADIPKSVYDQTIRWIFDGFLRWDAQYYFHIMVYGYVYENTLAFFPGFPYCVQAATIVFSAFAQVLSITSIHLLTSVIVNTIVFVFAARSLFHLTFKTLRDTRLAYYAACLFAFNPASIFFTAPYSEALFSFLTFQVMLWDNTCVSTAFVALSCAVRSNGIVNTGFPIYRELKKFVGTPFCYYRMIVFLCKIVCIVLCSSSTFVLYQLYCYKSFCSSYDYSFDEEVRNLAAEKSFILRGQNATKMCLSALPYFYIQNHYWNVGFLHYFTFKQLPNFALAFPIIYFTSTRCFQYFYLNSRLIPTLGMRKNVDKGVAADVFPYCVHAIFLLIICLFFVHIQVTTRFLCSSTPLVYWFGASCLKTTDKNSFIVRIFGTAFRIGYVQLYCFSYFIIGTALFSNSYPWT